MMKQLLMAMVLMPLMALADTETVDGITWTYAISGGTAEVKSGYYSSAIPTTTIGAINIPLVLGGKPVTSIGNYAFYSCSGITAVTIPSSVTSIGESAFYYCSGLTAVTIPSGVTRIGSYAFQYCSGLKSMTIPKSVTDLGYSVFYGCTGIESISLPFVGSRRGNGGNFSSLFGSGSGSVPATLTKVAITDDSTLPPYAFQNCKYIESITLPIGMSSIGYGAFQGCESLRSVPLPLGVSGIGSYAFQRCLSLTEMTIPVGVQQLESSVFDECLSLSRVTLPVGLTSIGYGAFRNCRNLYRINIPNTVTSISSGAFAGCTGLGSGVVVVDKCLLSVNGNCPANVVIDKDVRLIVGGAFSECENLQSVTINAQIEELPDDLFEYCSKLKKVVLPVSLQTIGDYAFYKCSSLEDIQLPEGLVEICEAAFAGCSSIRSFHVPASVTQLGSLPTGRWEDDDWDEVWIPSKLSQLTVAAGNKVYSAYNNMLYSKSGRILIWCLPSAASVSIRSGTKYIAGGAFQGCSKLTQLTIPEGVVAMGNLWDWFDFEEEDYPDDYMALLVDEEYVPDLHDYDEASMFYGCWSLRTLVLPSTLAFVDEYAFDDLPSLSSLTVASGNRKYAAYDNVFYDKEDKRLLRCPPALKTVKIWDKAESIASYAFEDCAALESLTIPASVKKIGIRPFFGCEKLKVVYYKGDAPFPLSYGRSGGICEQVSAPDSWEEVDEEEAAKIQEWWELYLFDSWGGGCSPRSEFLNVTSYVQKGTKWWGDTGEWQGRPLVFVDSIENPVVKYVVSFDPCGGEATVDHVEIESGKAIGMLPTPTRSKYKFNGWYTAVEGGTKISSTTKVTGDVTYYAQWMYDGSATVVVNVGSGCAGMGTVSGGKMAKAGTKVTLKATAKPGYVFAGWYRDEAGEEPVEGETDYRSPSYAYVVGEDDMTFYAKFIPVAEDWVSVWCQSADEYARGVEIEPLAVEVGSASLATVKVTGLPTGLKFTAKPMTLKATNNRAAVDLPANTIYGTPTKSGIYTATITATTAGKKSETYKVDFVVRGDGEYLVDVMGIDGADYPTNGSDMQHAIQWGKMSGYGAFVPGKTATLKATANKGYVFAGWFSEVACVCEGGEEDDGCIYTPAEGTVDYRSASFPVKVGYEDVLYYAKFVTAAEDAASIGATVDGFAFGAGSGGEGSDVTKMATNVMAGVYLAWPVAASALSLPTVKVAGLPSGLKFTAKPITTKVTSGTGASKVTTVVTNVPANTIYGAPSAASKTDKNGVVSPSKVKVTVTTSGKSKAEYVIDLTVDPLPAWAQGEFSGLASTPEGRLGSASMSVTAAGKVSGKVIVNGTNCTFSAASYDITSKTVGETNLVAVVTGKLGKEAVTGGITVVASGSTGTFADADMTLFRNVWKDKGAAPVSEDVQGLYTVKLGADERGTGYLSLTVDKKGAVKVAGKAPDGTALSGSATLIQSGDGYFADVFCAPSAYKGGYVAGRLEWSATGVVFALSALDWVSFNPQATMDYYAGGFVRSLSASGARYVKDDAPKSLGVADVLLATPEGVELKTFSFTQSTGVWMGTLLWDFSDPSFDSVKVLLEGVMVQGEDLDGFGTYDVSASYIPYDKNGNPQQEKTYKVKESMPAWFSWE